MERGRGAPAHHARRDHQRRADLRLPQLSDAGDGASGGGGASAANAAKAAVAAALRRERRRRRCLDDGVGRGADRRRVRLGAVAVDERAAVVRFGLGVGEERVVLCRVWGDSSCATTLVFVPRPRSQPPRALTAAPSPRRRSRPPKTALAQRLAAAHQSRRAQSRRGSWRPEGVRPMTTAARRPMAAARARARPRAAVPRAPRRRRRRAGRRAPRRRARRARPGWRSSYGEEGDRNNGRPVFVFGWGVGAAQVELNGAAARACGAAARCGARAPLPNRRSFAHHPCLWE